MPRCTATAKRTGERCQLQALKGATVCIRHGGAAPQVKRKAAQRVETAKVVRVLGLPRDVDPHHALLEEVHRTAGHVAALELIVSELERERLVGGITKTVQNPENGRTVTVQAGFSVWLRLYHAERKHLLDACRTAVGCGVERARVELQERQGALIADVFRHVLGDPALGLSADQRRTAMVATARHLRLIAGGQA